jgi:stage III sporulation protein AB
MVKSIGAVIVIVVSYLIGEYIYARLVSKVHILEELKKVGLIYRANIRHTRADVIDVFYEIYYRVSEDIGEFIKCIIDKINLKEDTNISVIWSESVQSNLCKYGLSDEELRVIDKFGDLLGSYDVEMQVENASVYIEEMEDRIKERNRSMVQNCKLCRSVSVVTGIFIVILIY